MSICARGLTRCLGGLPLRGLSVSSQRFISSKQAAEDPGSGCCKSGLGDVCKKEKKEEKKAKLEKKPNLECIEDPCCPDPPMKFDEEFKDLLVHKEKEYQRTWVECPPRRVVQKVVCGEPEPEPEPCKEEKKELPKSMECGKQNSKCPKITLPGCKPVMIHKDRCKKFPVPSDCEKIKAPYPSYSECAKPKPKPLHPTECSCLEMRSMCEVYTYLRKKGKKKEEKKEKKHCEM